MSFWKETGVWVGRVGGGKKGGKGVWVSGEARRGEGCGVGGWVGGLNRSCLGTAIACNPAIHVPTQWRGLTGICVICQVIFDCFPCKTVNGTRTRAAVSSNLRMTLALSLRVLQTKVPNNVLSSMMLGPDWCATSCNFPCVRSLLSLLVPRLLRVYVSVELRLACSSSPELHSEPAAPQFVRERFCQPPPRRRLDCDAAEQVWRCVSHAHTLLLLLPDLGLFQPVGGHTQVRLQSRGFRGWRRGISQVFLFVWVPLKGNKEHPAILPFPPKSKKNNKNRTNTKTQNKEATQQTKTHPSLGIAWNLAVARCSRYVRCRRGAGSLVCWTAATVAGPWICPSSSWAPRRSLRSRSFFLLSFFNGHQKKPPLVWSSQSMETSNGSILVGLDAWKLVACHLEKWALRKVQARRFPLRNWRC